MTLKIVKTCGSCGSASIDPDGKCFFCGSTPTKPCEVCDYKLDRRGRCASCAGVTGDDLHRLKLAWVYWTVCPEHGALEAKGRPALSGKKWNYPCAACGHLKSKGVESFKEQILLPPHTYQPEIDGRLERWKS